MPRFCTHLLIVLAAMIATTAARSASERQVVVLVFDGMRPDFVSAETTPNLWGLARDGVIFANHHPVFPSGNSA